MLSQHNVLYAPVKIAHFCPMLPKCIGYNTGRPVFSLVSACCAIPQQGEVAEASKAEAEAQSLKASGKPQHAPSTLATEGNKGNTDQGLARKEREQKLHRLTRKKRRRIMAREADEQQIKEEAEEMKAQGVAHVLFSTNRVGGFGRNSPNRPVPSNEEIPINSMVVIQFAFCKCHSMCS